MQTVATPGWYERLMACLGPWKRPDSGSLNLEPTVIARELLVWARDDGRWNPQANRDWLSLLEDLDVSWTQLGPRLAEVANVNSELEALRTVAATSPDHRRVVTAAAEILESALRGSDALVAAFDDLVDAVRREGRPGPANHGTQWRLALFASVAEQSGYDWGIAANRVRYSMEAVTRRSDHGLLQAARNALTRPPEQGHSIVWLAVNHAYTWGSSPNPTVQLFNGEGLLAVLENWTGPRDGVPPELASNPTRLPEACPKVSTGNDPKDEIPVTFARVDLGDGPVAGARDRALETLELLLARASANRRGTSWRISGVHLHFVDGEIVFESTGPVGDPDVYDRPGRLSIIHDHTAREVHDESERLRAHLPVRDGRMHDALQLSKWLANARDSPAPARLVLSGRILEQTANWAGLKVRALVEDLLSWAWARNELGRELAGAAFKAFHRPPHEPLPASVQEFARVRRQVIIEPRADNPGAVRVPAALEHLTWLADQFPAETDLGATLSSLQQRLSDGPMTAETLESMRLQLLRCNRRAVRTRNALVHGGPLVLAVAESVVDVHDHLGSQALEWVISGLAAERSLREVFAERRLQYADAVSRLRDGGDPRIIIAGLFSHRNNSDVA